MVCLGRRRRLQAVLSTTRTGSLIAVVLLGTAAISCAPGRSGGTTAPAATGYRGAVAIGIKDVPRKLPELSTGGTRELRTKVLMQMSPPSCGDDAELACPSEDEARLTFSMSALLDYRDPVDIVPPTRTLTSKSQGAQEIRMVLSELAPGSHCLLLTVAERPDEVVAGEFPSHGAAVVMRLDAGNSTRDHCNVEEGVGRALKNAPEIDGGCVDPVLSAKRSEVYLERRIDSGKDLWLFAPPCDHPRDVAFLSAGTFASSPGPLRLRAGGLSRMLPLGPQDEGSLQAVVSPVAGKRTAEAVLTQPVVIGN